MNDHDKEQTIERTFDDFRLSRGEKQALAQVIADANPSGEQLARYRNAAFALARKAIGSAGADILKWLEHVMKVLAPFGKADANAESHAYFSPDDNCPRRIMELLDISHTHIDICVFTITHDHIANSIIRAHDQGAKVRVITDREKADDMGSDIHKIQRAGVPTRLDFSRHHMHHKFAIFDQKTLLTGSFNWTRSAALHNDENLIITDDVSLVKDFSNEFEKLWQALEDSR